MTEHHNQEASTMPNPTLAPGPIPTRTEVYELVTAPVRALQLTEANTDDAIRWLGGAYRGAQHSTLIFEGIGGVMGYVAPGGWLLQQATGAFASATTAVFHQLYARQETRR